MEDALRGMLKRMEELIYVKAEAIQTVRKICRPSL